MASPHPSSVANDVCHLPLKGKAKRKFANTKSFRFYCQNGISNKAATQKASP